MNKLFNSIQEDLYTVCKYIKEPEKLVCDICSYDNCKYAWLISDKLYLKCLFKKHMKAKLNLLNPITFSEKMQWLKLYDRNPQYTIMADKMAVKQYVADKIGDEFIIPTIGVYNTVEDVPFDKLPERYVIKCTHDSGSTFIYDKQFEFNLDKVKKKLETRLKTNFFWYGREWVYKDITPKIIVEEFIPDEQGNCPVDYKFFCFNGKMEVFKIDYNRFTKRAANYYDKECQFLEFGKVNSTPDPSIRLELPSNFQKMVEITEILSEGIPFLRVDLYSVKGNIYFGELTFYPSSGIEPFTGDGDIIMGKMLDLTRHNG